MTTQRPIFKGPETGGPAAATTPPSFTNLAASGIVRSSLPAQRITTASKVPRSDNSNSSARASRTRALVSPSSLTAVSRKDDRRRLDSNRLSSTSGRTIAIGIPGRPAPAPKSRIDLASGGSTLRKSRLSSNRCSTIHSGLVEPMSRWTDPHLTNKSRYFRNVARSYWLGALSRIARNPTSKSFGRSAGPARFRLWRSP